MAQLYYRPTPARYQPPAAEVQVPAVPSVRPVQAPAPRPVQAPAPRPVQAPAPRPEPTLRRPALGGDIEGVIADVIAGQRTQAVPDVDRPLRFGEARDDALVERFRREQAEQPEYRPTFRPLERAQVRDDALVEQFLREQEEQTADVNSTAARDALVEQFLREQGARFEEAWDGALVEQFQREQADQAKLEEVVAAEGGTSALSPVSKYMLEIVNDDFEADKWYGRLKDDGSKMAFNAWMEYEYDVKEKIGVLGSMITNERDAQALVRDAYKQIHDPSVYERYMSIIIKKFVYKVSPRVLEDLTKCISIYLMLNPEATSDFIAMITSPEIPISKPQIGYGYNAREVYEKESARYRVLTHMGDLLVENINQNIRTYGLNNDYSNLFASLQGQEDLEEAWEEEQQREQEDLEEAWEEEQQREQEDLEEAWEEEQQREQEDLEEAWEEEQQREQEDLEEAWEEEQVQENMMDAQYKSAQVVPILRMLTLRPNNKPAQKEALFLSSGLRTLYVPGDIDVRALADALERTSPELAQALRSKRIVTTYRSAKL